MRRATNNFRTNLSVGLYTKTIPFNATERYKHIICLTFRALSQSDSLLGRQCWLETRKDEQELFTIIIGFLQFAHNGEWLVQTYERNYEDSIRNTEHGTLWKLLTLSVRQLCSICLCFRPNSDFARACVRVRTYVKAEMMIAAVTGSRTFLVKRNLRK
jgi:hypothetical protein